MITESMEAMQAALKVFHNKKSYLILQLLQERGEMNGLEIEFFLHKQQLDGCWEQAVVAAHLGKLHENFLVKKRREKKFIYYSFNKEVFEHLKQVCGSYEPSVYTSFREIDLKKTFPIV